MTQEERNKSDQKFEDWLRLRRLYQNFEQIINENKTGDIADREFELAPRGIRGWNEDNYERFKDNAFFDADTAYPVSVSVGHAGPSSYKSYINEWNDLYMHAMNKALRAGAIHHSDIGTSPAKIREVFPETMVQDYAYLSAIDFPYMPSKTDSIAPRQIATNREERSLAPLRPMNSAQQKSKPIYKQDPSVSGGQYQVGEYVWDNERKRWQTRMWDDEDKKASRELSTRREEKFRIVKNEDKKKA